MLEEVHIRGLGVIDDATLPLGPGLTVVSGETGAGKTMVVTGLLLLFGGRADASRVRTGSEQTAIDGRIEIAASSPVAARVRDAGGALDDGTGLVLRRTVSAAGRSRAYVGGAPTPVAVLAELSDRLLTVHGQSDQLRLVRPGEQRIVLDHFAGIELADYVVLFRSWRDATHALDERRSRIGELRREADLLAHGVAEIEAADPQAAEDLALTTLATRLAHADALALAGRAAHDALLGDPAATALEAADVSSLLGLARRTLLQQAGADVELDALTARVSELAALAADLGAELGAYADGLDADPARLELIEARRAVLAALVRKYGDGLEPGLSSVHEWARRATARLGEIDVSDEAIAALVVARDDAAHRLSAAAARLRERRSAAAARLAGAVTAELAGLAMPTSSCSVEVHPRPVVATGPTLSVGGAECGVGPDGADEVELMFRSHPDAPALPIGRGASGGELSRVMLALEVCLAGTDPVPTMVFDEVDAGVGGRAAVEVGRRLARLSRRHQVIVVTHLAQVAAYADRHVVVDKSGAGRRAQDAVVVEVPATPTTASESHGVTASDVRVVTGPDRVAELARMLGGSASDTALEHAAELLRTAREHADLDAMADMSADTTATRRPKKPRTSRRTSA